jgi:hypothetical protein
MHGPRAGVVAPHLVHRRSVVAALRRIGRTVPSDAPAHPEVEGRDDSMDMERGCVVMGDGLALVGVVVLFVVMLSPLFKKR